MWSDLHFRPKNWCARFNVTALILIEIFRHLILISLIFSLYKKIAGKLIIIQENLHLASHTVKKSDLNDFGNQVKKFNETHL